ncbi:hypothetical protein Rumeso_03532 [Rubellimicrobium mesophilum DSM 19309]|uniref:SCP domain-containing protein n=1 Tax=Rubellimicrobium mesophilum DSM 19309 TaxID=442562 RepID=A0A017HKL1_9RHOB|nr:CAP domain-containing protein [Rubellimicrobium mesophilum]EYD74891.1 hypothetical protein Rumeso_03532 [Rubellimicrobium mesophilum DSM 19309]
MRVQLIVATILAVAFGAQAQAAPIMAPVATSSAGESSQVVRVGFGERLDRARTRAGASDLRSSPRLRRAARAHAADMIDRSYFSHTAPDGSGPMERAQGADCRCHAIAENIAMGQRNAREVFKAWMNSPDHRDNMLRDGYSRFGLGHVGDTWVLMLSD